VVRCLSGGWSVAVVLAAFVVHCIVDGISYSFAVFYVDLLNEFTTQSHATLVLVGSLLPGTCLFVGQSVRPLVSCSSSVIVSFARHTGLYCSSVTMRCLRRALSATAAECIDKCVPQAN